MKHTLDHRQVRDLVARALAEDLGVGDITASLSLPSGVQGSARIIAKRPGFLAGGDVAAECFRQVDPTLEVQLLQAEGAKLAVGSVVMMVRGSAAAMLAGERTALNFMQRMSGIATLTAAYVAAVADTGARILDTRKTAPGLRHLDKYAVAIGGGQNHRIGLYDQVLLKENHFALARPASFVDVVKRCVAGSKATVIVEARNIQEAVDAVRGGAGVVLLDNFTPGDALVHAVRAVQEEAKRVQRTVLTEASGGITLENVRVVAACGVDRISIGALTHSVRALDLSMLVEGVE